MDRNIRNWLPAFFQKLDSDWLQNRPGLWASRIHYIALFWLFAAPLSAAIAWIMPLEHHSVPDLMVHLIWIFIPLVLVLAIWIRSLFRYRSTRQFGMYSWLQSLRNQGVYLLGLLMLASIPMIYTQVWVHKVRTTVASTELAEDINLFLSLAVYEQLLGEENAREEAWKDYFKEVLNSPFLDNAEYYSDIRGIKKPELLMDLILNEYSLSQRQDQIQEIEKRFAKYQETAIELNPEIWANGTWDGSMGPKINEYELRRHLYNCKTQINKIIEIQQADFAFFSITRPWAFFHLVSLIWLSLTVMLSLSWPQIRLSILWILLGFLPFILFVKCIGLFFWSMDWDFGHLIYLPEYGYWMIWFAFFSWFAFRKQNNKKAINHKGAAFLLLIFGIYFFSGTQAGIYFIDDISGFNIVHHTFGFFYYLIATLLTFLLWNVFFERRVLKLFAQPKNT